MFYLCHRSTSLVLVLAVVKGMSRLRFVLVYLKALWNTMDWVVLKFLIFSEFPIFLYVLNSSAASCIVLCLARCRG